jgi:TctA family transporter
MSSVSIDKPNAVCGAFFIVVGGIFAAQSLAVDLGSWLRIGPGGLLLHRRAARHADRRAARHRPTATIAMLLPITFRSAARSRADHARRHLLRRAVRRLDHRHPGQPARRILVGGDRLDGYQMARQGRAGPALAIAAIGSFFAGTVATLLIAALRAAAGRSRAEVRPGRIFLADGARPGRRRRARARLGVKALGMVVLGLLLGLVGTDVNSGTPRSPSASRSCDGIELRRLAMGLFGFAEIICAISRTEHPRGADAKVTGLMPTRRTLKAA